MEQFDGARPGLPAVQALVHDQGLTYLFLNRMQWIQRRHRLLENHRYACTANHLHAGLRCGEQILAGKADRTPGM